jgi:hypothetical protein
MDEIMCMLILSNNMIPYMRRDGKLPPNFARTVEKNMRAFCFVERDVRLELPKNFARNWYRNEVATILVDTLPYEDISTTTTTTYCKTPTF